MFDWSKLPDEIKRIIFKYNRLSNKSKFELMEIKKMNLMSKILNHIL